MRVAARGQGDDAKGARQAAQEVDNVFLDRVIETLYPKADAPGHGFVNGGQGGPHVEQFGRASSVIPSTPTRRPRLLVVRGNRNVEEI